MKSLKTLRKTLDVTGAASLAASAGILGDLMLEKIGGWGQTLSFHVELVPFFQIGIVITLIAFMGARIIQLVEVVRANPHHRRDARQRQPVQAERASPPRAETLLLSARKSSELSRVA